MTTWLIQDSDRYNSSIENEILPLRELGFNIKTFGILPFTYTITGLDDLDSTETYIVRGSTKIVEMLSTFVSDNLSTDQLKAMANGISYDREKFDQAYYSKLGLPLLNNEPEILDLQDEKNLYLSCSTPKFVKPSSDLKAFNAGIMEAGEVLKYFIENNYHRSDYAKETVLIHDVQEIDAEYRFICINGEVITGSQYRDKHKLNLNSHIPSYVHVAAYDYAKLYRPSDIYTMDLAETPDGIKIIEYNCWNASGLYAMDIKHLFSVIDDYYRNYKVLV